MQVASSNLSVYCNKGLRSQTSSSSSSSTSRFAPTRTVLLTNLLLVAPLVPYLLVSKLFEPIDSVWLIVFSLVGTVAGLAVCRLFQRRYAFLMAPTHTNAIPRCIPPHQWYQTPIMQIITSAGAAFIFNCPVLNEVIKLWAKGEFAAFYYLLAIFGLCGGVALVSVISLCLQLNREDYHWWFRSAGTGWACGLYVGVFGTTFCIANGASFENVVAWILFTYYLSFILGSITHFACKKFLWLLYRRIIFDF
jgi:hypothetical protein